MSQDNGVVTLFAYDAFGNMTTKAETASTQTTYLYDPANRLTRIAPASGTVANFTLDALGRFKTRVLSSNPVTTDTYAYLDTSATVAEISSTVSGGATTTTRALLDLTGARLALRVGTSVSWTLFDTLGSLVGLENAGRTLTDARRFDGYGETVATAGGTPNPWAFRGSLDLSPSGVPLYAMGARFYAPSLGTFTQLDTYGGSAADPASMNRFLYAEANPATLIDPSGHRACLELDTRCQPVPYVTPGKPPAATTSTGRSGAPQCNSSYCGPVSNQSPTGPTLHDSRPPDQYLPMSGLRAQLKGQCQGSGVQNYGYCLSYDWAPGLDGPAQDDTPSMLTPLLLASPLVIAGAAACFGIGVCEAALSASGEALIAYDLGIPIGTAAAAGIPAAYAGSRAAASPAGQWLLERLGSLSSTFKGSGAAAADAAAPRVPIAYRANGSPIWPIMGASDEAASAGRVINVRPATESWGLTSEHLTKHVFGDGPLSLTKIDPGGDTYLWNSYLQDLAGRGPTAYRNDGIFDIVGAFPKADGSGVFQFGVRLSPNSDGTFDLVTLLTQQ